MAKYKMRTILESALGSKNVLAPLRDTHVFKGHGDTDYVCTPCGTVFAENCNEREVRDVVFKCPNCGKFSEV